MPEVTRKRNFHHLQKYLAAFKIRYLIGRSHDAIWKLQKFIQHKQFTWTQSVMESLSYPLWDSVISHIGALSRSRWTYLNPYNIIDIHIVMVIIFFESFKNIKWYYMYMYVTLRHRGLYRNTITWRINCLFIALSAPADLLRVQFKIFSLHFFISLK